MLPHAIRKTTRLQPAAFHLREMSQTIRKIRFENRNTGNNSPINEDIIHVFGGIYGENAEVIKKNSAKPFIIYKAYLAIFDVFILQTSYLFPASKSFCFSSFVRLS